MNNIEDIPLILFEEINFIKNKYEYCFKYASSKIIQNNNFILIFNPKNNYFFGEICMMQNITWLINNEFENINCYFIDTPYALGFNINLKKEIINEKELYIYFKGKIPGTLELYDLTKNKTLNISFSYRIPYITNFPSDKSINFILPKLNENIYINFIINNYGLEENITISSIFEIYKDNNKVQYENNILILDKNKEYYFKYYPGEYELLINFFPIYSNKFLEKQFYIGKKDNIYINYNIESISLNQTFGLFFDFNGVINIKGDYSNEIKGNQESNEEHIINIKNKYFNLIKNDDDYKYINLDIKFNAELISDLIIYDINEIKIIDKIDYIYNIKKAKNYLILFEETLLKNYAKFQAYCIISINNENNIIKLIPINDDIITSKNYILTKLNKIQGIFIKANENDTLMTKLISEEISKYINEETGSFFYSFSNTFIDNKKYSIDFIYCNTDIYSFYNSLSNDLKIYEINNISNIEDISNNYLNYSLLPWNENILEEKKTYMILKESSNAFIYEKYFTDFVLGLIYILDYSKIYYLLSDFEYSFEYNNKIKKILIKVLNNNNKKAKINFICNNQITEIKNDIEILNIENCDETFILSGNNTLVYIYLPLTVKNSYQVIRDEDSFELFYIYHLFFVPKNNGFNSINILLQIENDDNDYPVFLDYYIDYGIIPFSRNIETKQIIFRNKANLVIPNYANLSNINETYFIYFRFNTTISRLNATIIYENIIYLEDQTYIVLNPGINTIKFLNDIDHYLNLTKLNKNNNKNIKSYYTIYKDEIPIQKNTINDSDNIIYIEEPSYRENIKLKIENDEEILLRVSPENFEDFSFISYNKNLDIKQIDNKLRIKFNTTNYKSKLEYQIALIEKEDNIDSILIQKKFADNNILYKTIIHSTGKESIESNISLLNNNDITYDQNYTIIAYGKDFYGNNLNYFYMEPTTLYISNPYKTDINEVYNNITNNITNNSDDNIIETNESNTINILKETNAITNSIESIIPNPNVEITTKITTEPTNTKPNVEYTNVIEYKDNTDNIIIEPSITLIEKETDETDENKPLIRINLTKDNDDSKKNTIIIVFSILGCVVVLAGVIALAIYFKKKSSNMVINTAVATNSSYNSGMVHLKN